MTKQTYDKAGSMLVYRLGGVALLLAVLRYAFSAGGDSFTGFLDLRAVSLVFLAPIALVFVFGKGRIAGENLVTRLRSLLRSARLGPEALRAELEAETEAVTGVYGSGRLVRLSETHPEPFVRYATGLLASRYTGAELAPLLVRKIEAEDRQWQGLRDLAGFLAKMAPYFGMLATVIGMIRLLENLNDFSKISGSMALAMQGTLYGLVSFTLIYAPMQRFLQGAREQVFLRNELVARWVTLLAARTEPALIREELRSRFADSSPAVRLVVTGPMAAEGKST